MRKKIVELIRNPRLIIKSVHAHAIDIYIILRNSFLKYYTPYSHKKALKGVCKKEKIRCVFLALDASVWKCDSVYRAMLQDDYFEPLILVCPIINHGKENMLIKMQECYEMFVNKGYNVIKAYCKEDDDYVNIKSLKPDVLFYTNPYPGLIHNDYYITRFSNVLTVYIPYYINGTNNNRMAYDLPMHNFCWRYYVESDLHKDYSKKYSKIKGKNVVVTGYPGIEDFISHNYCAKNDEWKIKDRKIKRIIWAPHQTIVAEGDVFYSCFLEYCYFMIEMAEKYSEYIQLVFKPHPLLKTRLYEKWGKKETDEYYAKWENMPNTTIITSDYHDLFLTSDAMIHDCGSFTIEYLYLNKPTMRLMNDIEPRKMFGDFGIDCINMHYLGYEAKDIELFIKNVIEDIDLLKEQRTEFIHNVLIPSVGLPSENILKDIYESIKKQRVYAE